MRIISGTARGRRLFTPSRGGGISPIRPTADRVRESLFNILGDRGAGDVTLDLFAGTGALGLEALSRGCQRAVFVDTSSDAIRLVKKNLDICGFSNRATILRRDLLKAPSFLRKIMPGGGFDLIFVDPPYRRGLSVEIIRYIGKFGLLSKDGLLVAEEASDIELPDDIDCLQKSDRRVYGDTAICFYRNNVDEKQHE
ncbi:MAG: 16S rRNA (guanine(966)-N(2))-methyltransferase RsmD [Desulfobulbaceae bacterium]|nr:16S rRNA (guanine(966)-N(2))-methyltransferase RsmD [Desulfobulbaceae bacterium]